MSTDIFQTLSHALPACFAQQATATAQWHEAEAADVPFTEEATLANLPQLVLAQHQCNFRLWHVEDTARRTDVDDTVIAKCKRTIDGLNQRRNDLMEKVDTCLTTLMAPALPRTPNPGLNTETLGMAVDRLSILALKVYHMREQTLRTDVDAAHKANCTQKLETLVQQRAALERAVLGLLEEYREGRKTPMVYHQCKMYNDPSLNPELYKAAGK